MIRCNVLCEHNPESIVDDPMEEWLPFVVTSCKNIVAAKMAGPFSDSFLAGKAEAKCTTLFLASGESFIIDIPFSSFVKQLEECQQKQQ